MGWMLCGVYQHCEEALEKLVKKVDGDLPQGANYHKELIERAAAEVPDIRGAIITPKTARDMHGLRGLRHVLRNNYGDDFEYARAAPNLNVAKRLMQNFELDVSTFAKAFGIIEKGPIE